MRWEPLHFLARRSSGRVLLGLRFGVGLDGGFALGDFFLGAGEVDQFERNLLPLFALRAEVADAILLHLVFAGGLKGAVLQVQADLRAEGRASANRSRIEDTPAYRLPSIMEECAIVHWDAPESRSARSDMGPGASAGSMWLGGTDDESIAALRRAIELGLNFIDTALVYGDGHSERLVGKIAPAVGDYRDQGSAEESAVAGAAGHRDRRGFPVRLHHELHRREPAESGARAHRSAATARVESGVDRIATNGGARLRI